MKINMAPGRIAVTKKEAKLKGGIFLPPARNKLYEIGEVAWVGNLESYGPEGKTCTKEVYQPGDLVLFQLPAHMAPMIGHVIAGKLYAMIMADDIIGKLATDEICLENFKVAGRFVLLQPDIRQPSKLIVMPDQVEETTKQESLHFSVLQKGADVKIDVSLGQEVFPNKGYCNPIGIDGKDLAFVDQANIMGSLSV